MLILLNIYLRCSDIKSIKGVVKKIGCFEKKSSELDKNIKK